MSKAFSTALSLGLAGLTVASISASTYAVTGDVKLNVNVDPAIALTIQSSSDGSTIYAESDPAGQVVNNYTGEGLTPFGTSSAKTNMLPNTADESMWSKVTVYTNNTEGYKLTVSDTDDNTSLVSGSYTIPTSATIAAGTSAWAFKGGKFADYTAMSPISSALTIAESITKSAVDGDTTEIHYGVSTSADQATGTYSDTIVYTVTGEGVTNDPVEVTMQTFDSATMLLNVNDTASLRDERDDKYYTVTRLADGNVWMTQNLDLDLDSNKTLTPDDTDITSNWTPVRSTITTVKLNSYTWNNDQNTPYSYDSGESTYGNYYNWSAAVAMNDTSSVTQWDVNAQTSICPKGWTLPQNGTTGKTYTNLGAAYGLPTSNNINSTAYNVLEEEPLNFVRAGYVVSGSVYYQSSYGGYWSSTVGNSRYAYDLNYNNGNYNPQSTNYRYFGFSVRCVAN